MNNKASSGHLPSLDGLRGISIILVLIGHLNGTQNVGWLPIQWLGDLGHLGVTVFFVISGFLITSLLMKEQVRHGRVSIRLFYARRALRIFPAGFALIGVVAALSAAGLIQLHKNDLLHAVTYTVNFSPERSWWIGHLWSLSVEEQFYMLWPAAFVLFGLRRAPWVAMLAVVTGPVARAAMWYFFRGTPWRDAPVFPVVADSIAIGCVLALNREWLERQNWYRSLFHPLWSAVIILIVFGLNSLHNYTIAAVFGSSIINILLGIIIHRSVCLPEDGAGRLLNSRSLAFIGTLSYSLYLWQQLFLNRESTAWVHAFPQNLALAVGAAMMSFFLLEKPLIGMRERLRRQGSPRDQLVASVGRE